jgi:hypothetical protein
MNDLQSQFGRVSEEVKKSILEISDLEELDKLFTKKSFWLIV